MNPRMLAIAIACALGASRADADPKTEARAHMEAAGAAYKEGRFEVTLEELDKAYALDPDPALHYSIGQVYVKLNRCQDAIASYERFLASKPPAAQADLANQAIETCKTQLAARPVPEPEPRPQPQPEAVPAPAQPTTTDTRPAWYKDKLGLGLVGGGAVVTVVGLVMLSNAHGQIDDAEAAPSYGESQSIYDDARSARTTALIVTTIGVAAAGVGVWRLVKKRGEERRGLALVPTTTGGLITYSGGF